MIGEQGWRQGLSDGRGPTLLIVGLSYVFKGAINARNLQKNWFLPSEEGLAVLTDGYMFLSPPLAPPRIGIMRHSSIHLPISK